MNLLKLQTVLIAIATYSPQVLGAEPYAGFKLHENKRSYTFRLENLSDTDIDCRRIEVRAELFDRACTTRIRTYNFVQTDVVVAAGQIVTNPNLGIDFSNFYGNQAVYCGSPTIIFDCE